MNSLDVLRRTILWTSAATLILFLSAISPAGSAQRASLTLVSTAWPPFTNAPGQPRFALDLVEAALGRIGLTSKTTIVSAAEFTPALLGGQFDGSGCCSFPNPISRTAWCSSGNMAATFPRKR
jgi:hypothetical protein